jgi:hypothetical protein
MANSFTSEAAAKKELENRKKASKITYANDTIFKIKHVFFVGTYYEYKMLLDL